MQRGGEGVDQLASLHSAPLRYLVPLSLEYNETPMEYNETPMGSITNTVEYNETPMGISRLVRGQCSDYGFM